MKTTPDDPRCTSTSIPTIDFREGTSLTSFAGLVLFQRLFVTLGLLARLRGVFAHLPDNRDYDRGKVLLLLVVHLLLGWRRLRSLDMYRNDPLVRRVVGMDTLPSVSTFGRILHDADDASVEGLRGVCRDLVFERLAAESLRRVTIDFDGSVQSTKALAEGTAVGFNKKKKGARSYYPLYATVAQVASLLDLHHRPGNVHDSIGAEGFMDFLFSEARRHLGKAVQLESRMDSAFFSRPIIQNLLRLGISFTCSVPFERLPELKQVVENAPRWHRINKQWSYAEAAYLPQSWKDEGLDGRLRFILFRQKAPKQRKGPVPAAEQLDLFLPSSHEYVYKVILTNRLADSAAAVMRFHHGRGSQEKVFGEANQHASLGVVATRGLHANQTYTLAAMLAHNLGRELQMATTSPSPNRALVRTRPALWRFQELGTLGMRVIRRAGRLVRPQGRDTLVIGATEATKEAFEELLGPHREPACNGHRGDAKGQASALDRKAA